MVWSAKSFLSEGKRYILLFPPIFDDFQVIYTSLSLVREVQRITVDAAANVSEVRRFQSLLRSLFFRYTSVVARVV